MRRLFFYLLIALPIIEGILVVLATINIPVDTKNAFLLGFSKIRLILLLIQLFGILSFIILFLFRNRFLNWIENRLNTNKANDLITSIGILSYFFLWIVIFTPTKNLYLLEASFIRSKPTLLWLGLILMQFVLWIKISKRTFYISIENSLLNIKILLLAFLPLSIAWVIITISKVGLVNNTPYWNVPGIPLSMLQFICITVFLLQAIIYSSCRTSNIKSLSLFVKLLIPLLIYITTVLIWGFTPMLKHYFSLEPTLPNMQPYPYSDARVHDLGALSIVMGKGIYFNRFTDKPLYMVFLAILHVFTGNDYHLLQWA